MNVQNFLLGLLGENDPGALLNMFTWAIAAAIFSILIDSTNRDPLSTGSPVKFSWIYFAKDNLMRLVTTLLALIFAIRFSTELFGLQPTMFNGLLFGLGADQIVLRLKNLRKKQQSKFNPPNTAMQLIAFPTIDVHSDTLTAFDGTPFPQPLTGASLAASDARFHIREDEDSNPVLCSEIAVGATLPVLETADFGPAQAEAFVGPRPPRRRPR